MANAVYSKASPYYTTGLFGSFLDVMTFRPITKIDTDVKYTIDVMYKYRPDMLAFDLYGRSDLWWVFAARNPNVLKDPLFDFIPGVTIFLPTQATLKSDLGL